MKIVDSTLAIIMEAVGDSDSTLSGRCPRDITELVISNITVNLLGIMINSNAPAQSRLKSVESFLDDLKDTVLEMWKIIEVSMVDRSNPQ